MTHVAQCRLCQPIFTIIVVVATQRTIITGYSVVATVRTYAFYPLVAQLSGFVRAFLLLQLIDAVHHIGRILMVDEREERVAIQTLLTKILLFQRKYVRIVAQLAIYMHLRLIVVLQSCAVQLFLVDSVQEGQRFVVIAHGRTLESH